MAMKETERSLRTYFLVIGVLMLLMALEEGSKLEGLTFALPADWKVALYVPLASRVVLGAGFLIAGINLYDSLLTGAGWIKKLLAFSLVMMCINGALVTAILDLDAAQSGIVGAVIGALIVVYLYRSVTRLSAQAIKRAGLPTPPPEAKVV